MRFEKTQKSRPISAITNPRLNQVIPTGSHVTKNGKLSHHPKGMYSTNKKAKPITFTGVDGEGMTVNGTHRYVLFGVGDRQIEDTTGLRWSDCFELLYDIHRDSGQRDNAYVGFFLGYDFSQIFKTLPEERARMLLTKEGRDKRAHRAYRYGTLQRSGRPGMPPHPVEYDGWQFDLLGMKRLRIRPKECDCEVASCKCPKKPSWMYVCDTGSFFQQSFLKVIDPSGWPEGTEIVTPEEWAIVKAGKEKRSTAVLDTEMRMYNALENKILSRVMGVLDSGFRDIGVNLSPAKWFGPGQAAQAWLKTQGVPGREEIASAVPLRMAEAARASYFGGWFEIMMHGIIPRVTHEYDINSAYPSVIAELPCLLHGTYEHGDGLPTNRNGSLTLVYGVVQSPAQPYTWKWKGQHIGAMLHRERGQISRPMKTEGWFWWDELQAAQRCGMIKKLDNKTEGQHIDKWISYTPCDCPKPMRDIAGLYDKRLAVGKKTPRGKAAKLVYNSAYGKFAQSSGMNPVFGNAIYASRITAGCRIKILDAIATHPYGKSDVAMVATDAVYFLHPHPTLPISEKLGEWDHVEKTNLTLFKPGVYWDDSTRRRITSGENPNFKARGFKASDFIAALGRIDSEFANWDMVSDDEIAKLNKADMSITGIVQKSKWNWPKVTFSPSFVMTTALQALQRNKWETAGAVKTEGVELTQDSDPWMKRETLWREDYRGRTVYRSRPRSHTFEPSEPYEKHFGMEDPWSDEFRAGMGETQEGRIMDILSWILNGD